MNGAATADLLIPTALKLNLHLALAYTLLNPWHFLAVALLARWKNQF